MTNAVEWSDEYYELLGLKAAELPASFAEWSRRVHPDDLPMVLKEHEIAIAEKRDANVEFRIQRVDGEWRWFHRTGRCTYAANGKALWSFPTNRSWKASPMTYMFDGKQVVAVAAGPNIIALTIHD